LIGQIEIIGFEISGLWLVGDRGQNEMMRDYGEFVEDYVGSHLERDTQWEVSRNDYGANDWYEMVVLHCPVY